MTNYISKSEKIMEGLRKSFQTTDCKMANRTCYGYTTAADGELTVNETEAAIVKWIFDRYLTGESFGKIATVLEKQCVLSPTGKAKWNREAISKLLSNGKYVPYAIPVELFVTAQFEKESRTNIQTNNDGSTQRKTTRYSSQNVLSGLLVCAECGSNYRRITRPSGEVVWRCADRVEKGKGSVCKHSLTIADTFIKNLICMKLGLIEFDELAVQGKFSQIIITHNNQIQIHILPYFNEPTTCPPFLDTVL